MMMDAATEKVLRCDMMISFLMPIPCSADRILAVHLDLNQPSARGGLRWINRFREHIVTVMAQVPPTLENRDETCCSVDHALRILRACDRPNVGMPVNTEGERSSRLLRQGFAAQEYGQAGFRIRDVFNAFNPAGPTWRYARQRKRPPGRQNKQYLPRLLSLR